MAQFVFLMTLRLWRRGLVIYDHKLMGDIAENSAQPEQLSAICEELFQTNELAVWKASPDLASISTITDRIVSLTGFRSSEFSQPNFKIGRIHPQDLEALRQCISDCTVQQPQFDIVYRFKDSSGNYVSLRDMGTVRFGPDGSPVAVSGMTVKQREKQVTPMERHEETQILLDMIPAMVWYKDPKNLILRVNKAAAQAVGSTPTEMEGRHTADFYGAAEADKYYQDDYEVVVSKKPKMGIVEQLKTADGSRRWVRTDKVPVLGPDGTTCGIVVFSVDVTEDQRKKTELLQDRRQLQFKIEERTQTLRDTESKLAALSRVVPGILYQFVLSPDGSRQVPYVSEGARELLGWDPEKIQADAELAFASVHPDDLERLADLIAESASTLTNFKFEGRFFKADGEITWLQARAKPELLPNGDILWNGLLSDISDMKEAQQQIKRLNDDLEHRVSILAAVNNELELLTQKLEQSYDQALEASRLKSEFVANISHEVRTPISAVIGMSELLMDTNLSDEQREYTSLVQESALSLLAIINDILDFSKMEAGKIDLELIEFSLLPLVEGCAELLSASARERGLSLITFVDPRLPRTLLGDPVRLRQVLLNLLSNAIKFTEEGEVVVRAEPVNEIEGLISVRIEVIDTGIGLSEAARKLLFQPFVQGDGSTSRKYGGTGLGLSICKRLVELMGGDIGVESELGAGSKFWCMVPFRAMPETVAEAPGHSGTPIRAIICDDSQRSAEVNSTYLTRAGVETFIAESEAALISQLQSAYESGSPYNVVLVGTTHGVSDLVSRVRSHGKFDNVRFIMISPFDDKERLEAAVDMGFSACLVRPIRQSQLSETVTKIFSLPESQLPGQQLSKQTSDRAAARGPTGVKIAIDKPILVAEDNQVMQQLAVRRIQKMGLVADAVRSGREVLEALKKQQYALILMDCQMPEMDGFEATAEIRRDEATSTTGRHIPIIAMTASAMVGDREHCLTSGMDDYLSKPVSQEQLTRVLQKWLDVHGSANSDTEARVSSNSVSHQETASSQSRELAAEEISQNADDTTSGARAAMDAEQLEQLYGIEDMRTLLQSFSEEAISLLESIKVHRQSQDARELGMQVHQLKGLASVMTAEPLAGECRLLEEVTRQHDWIEVDKRIECVKRQLDLTLQACSDLLG